MGEVVHELPGNLLEWGTSPWPLAQELARILPMRSWTLVGGLMVRLRAIIHDVPPNRATTDVDATVSLTRDNGTTYRQLAGTLIAAGFNTVANGEFAYRFDRVKDGSRDVVDLMFPDGVPPRVVPTYQGVPVLSVPGGRRAISQRELVVWKSDEAQSAPIYIPSLRDALVIKGAAYLVDGRDRTRHLSDAITLLACVENPVAMHQGLSRASRKRIRGLLRGLESREVWTYADPVSRDLARLVIDEMRARFDATGTVTPDRAAQDYGDE